MFKKMTLFIIAVAMSSFAWAQSCSDLFISEYIEGSSSNKAFEIYNPTSATIDLTDYVVYRYNNGSLTPTDSLFPQDMLLAGDVFVVGNPSANATILAESDTTHSLCFYNGDDAVSLIKISTNDTLDIIGEIGVDPGSGWIVGTGATNNTTLVRMVGVQEGTTDWAQSVLEWDVFAIDMVDSVGAHSMTSCIVATLCPEPFFSEYIEGSSSNKALEIYNPSGVDLDLTNYVIYRFNNGSLTATDSLFPLGTLVAGDVFVAANPSANPAIMAQADTTHTITFYNGDDAILLLNMVTGDSLDIIGEIGVDPGSGWTVGTGATNNTTLIRMIGIQQGNTNWAVAATEWDVFPIDMTDSLGMHTMTECSIAVPNVVAAGAGMDVCDGVAVNFTSSATGGDGGPYTYFWDFGDSNNSTQQNPSHTYSGTGTYTVIVTATDGSSNMDDTTFTVTVTANADATITPAGPFCESDPMQTLTAVDPLGIWSGAGITDVNLGSFDPAVAGVGNHPITYTISGPCGDMQTTTITVVQNSDATITPAGPFCETDPVQTLTAVDPLGIWSGIGIIDANAGTFDPATAGPGTHSISYTIGGPCGDSNTINIIVDPQANTTITPAGPFCETDPIQTLTAVDPLGIWSGIGIIDPNNGTFDPATAGAGTHNVTYTITGNCGNSSIVSITVTPLADATIGAVPYPSFGSYICHFDPTMMLTAADPGGYWTGESIDSLTGVFDPFDYLNNHGILNFPCDSIPIYYTIPGVCGDIDSTTIVQCVCSGIEENQWQNAITVSPNPSNSGLFNLDLAALKDWKATIAVTDITGRLIQTEQLLAETYSWTVDLSNQSSGTYLISISGEFGRVVKKLIIE
jgi:PKD repeat protein